MSFLDVLVSKQTKEHKESMKEKTFISLKINIFRIVIQWSNL